MEAIKGLEQWKEDSALMSLISRRNGALPMRHVKSPLSQKDAKILAKKVGKRKKRKRQAKRSRKNNR